MRRRTVKSAVVAAAVVAFGMLSIAIADVRSPVLPAATQPAGGVITLNGTYTTSHGGGVTEPLKAVLTPSGANEWKVTFTFNFKNQPYTYVGTITGNLKNGQVDCKADGSGRKFGFKGTAANGVLTFDSFETRDNYKTTIPKGTGTLK